MSDKQFFGSINLPPTPRQVLGPYFLQNSPIRQQMFPDGAAGARIRYSGQVLSTNGKPVAGAVVHIWLADANGSYDNQDAKGGAHPLPPEKHRYRGRVITDANGRYSFECIRPGNYQVGPGAWRPAHIHVRIDAAGFNKLVTQLYFADDPYNEHDLEGDDFFQPELVAPLQPEKPVSGQAQTGTFSFVLERS